jgi:hypothetical protein
LHTDESGEIFSKTGEFFVTIQGKRYPNKGHVRMTIGDTFVPPGSPIIYSAILNSKHQMEWPFKIEVIEEDPVINSTMLEHSFDLRLKEGFTETYNLPSKNNKLLFKFSSKIEIYPGQLIQKSERLTATKIIKTEPNFDGKGTINILGVSTSPMEYAMAKSKAAAKSKKDNRYFCNIYVLQLHVEKSGDFFSKSGEFYFKVADHRFPNKGIFKMAIKDTLLFPNKVNVFTGVINEKDFPYGWIFNFKVMEEDLIKDDVMINHKITIEWKKYFEQNFQLISHDGTVRVMASVSIEQVENW